MKMALYGSTPSCSPLFRSLRSPRGDAWRVQWCHYSTVVLPYNCSDSDSLGGVRWPTCTTHRFSTKLRREVYDNCSGLTRLIEFKKCLQMDSFFRSWVQLLALRQLYAVPTFNPFHSIRRCTVLFTSSCIGRTGSSCVSVRDH